jgi:hypothetical protein
MEARAMSIRLALGLACLFTTMAFAQVADEAPAVEAPPAALPSYQFAVAAVSTQEETAQALTAYSASPAELLFLLADSPVDTAAASKRVVVLAPDTKDLAIEQREDTFLLLRPDPTGAFAGAAQTARRAHRASRWSIGIAHKFTPFADPRLDLVLERDDPLDVMIVKESTLATEGARAPLGPTRVFSLAAHAAGALALFEVSESGVTPVAAPALEEPKPDAEAAENKTP